MIGAILRLILSVPILVFGIIIKEPIPAFYCHLFAGYFLAFNSFCRVLSLRFDLRRSLFAKHFYFIGLPFTRIDLLLKDFRKNSLNWDNAVLVCSFAFFLWNTFEGNRVIHIMLFLVQYVVFEFTLTAFLFFISKRENFYKHILNFALIQAAIVSISNSGKDVSGLSYLNKYYPFIGGFYLVEQNMLVPWLIILLLTCSLVIALVKTKYAQWPVS